MQLSNVNNAAPQKPLYTEISTSLIETKKDFGVQYKKSDFKPVPNKLHMIWVASMPAETQMNYIKNWAEKNPGYEVNFWVDSQHFNTYAENKDVRNQVDRLFSDQISYNQERLLRGLVNQLKISLNSAPFEMPGSEVQQAVKELNKTLNEPEFSQWKGKLTNTTEILPEKALEFIKAFETLTKANDEKFLEADRLILNQTVKQWDMRDSRPRDLNTLNEISEQLSQYRNIRVRDISNHNDLTLKNQDVYTHEMIGRNGGYPAASDIARYEILHDPKYGGVYVDIDFECIKPLEPSKILAHPDLILIDIGEARQEGIGTPYVANALLASHPNSQMIGQLIEVIGRTYAEMKGNSFQGSRYFDRPNKSTIETTGPNALRSHVMTTIGSPRTDVGSLMSRVWDKKDPVNDSFWEALESHFVFPKGFANGDTPEQAKSATKAMAFSNVDQPEQNLDQLQVANTVIGIEELNKRLQEKLNEKKLNGKPDLIFLLGASTSGKSTLSTALNEVVNTSVSIIKTDHFLKSFAELSQHPANKGKPIAEWPVVHGHPDSYHKEALEALMSAIKKGESYRYSIPAKFIEDTRIENDPYPRGARDVNGPYLEINIPASQTYIIEGVSSPHLIDSDEQIVIKLDVDYETSVSRRAARHAFYRSSGERTIPEVVERIEDKAQYDAVVASMKALQDRLIMPDISLDSTGQKPGYFKYIQPVSQTVVSADVFTANLQKTVEHLDNQQNTQNLALYLLENTIAPTVKNKVRLSEQIESKNILTRIFSSSMPEKNKFAVLNKLINLIDYEVPSGQALNKEEKVIKHNLLFSVVAFHDRLTEIDPQFNSRFPEKPFDTDKKILVNIVNINGGGDISFGSKLAEILSSKVGKDHVSVVIRNRKADDPLDFDISAKNPKSINLIKAEDAGTFDPDLLLMVPARSQYKQQDAPMFNPDQIRTYLGLDRHLPFLGLSEYSSVNAENRVINENTEIARTGLGRNNLGIFLSDRYYSPSERPVSERYFFGYSQHPNAQIAFMKDIIQSYDSKPLVGESEFTFVLPGKIVTFYEDYAKNPNWRSFLQDTGCNQLILQDMNGEKLASTEIQAVKDAPNIIIRAGKLSGDDFLKYAYFSEDTVLVTGDQSMSEMLSMGKYVVYEEQNHKRLLPVDTFLSEQKGAQFYLSKLEGIYAHGQGKEIITDSIQKNFNQLLPRQPRLDGRPDMVSVLSNPREGLKNYIKSEKVRREYAQFISGIKINNDIEKNILPAILKGDIRRKVSQW